jgi:hypothetical protein
MTAVAGHGRDRDASVARLIFDLSLAQTNELLHVLCLREAQT